LANLIFTELTKEKITWIVAAEKELKKAGIIIETEIKLGTNRSYAWKLDTIKNAYVEYDKPDKQERDSKGHFIKGNVRAVSPKRDDNGRFIK